MGVDLLPLGGRPPELTMPPSRRLRNPDLIVVRSPLAVSDIVTLSRLPVTAPERTAFDLACSLPFVEAVSAVDALLNRRVVTHAAVRDFAKIAAPRPGSRRAVRAVEVADDGAESPMETRLRLCLVAAGLPRPETQVRVVSRDGVFIGRVDLAYRRQRVGLEYEGDHHRTRATFRQDIARINAMQEAGWIIIRATHDDIRNPATLIRQLRRLLAERTP
ncbi:MAG TPA: hypothetical protein VKB69_14270 [Micromonosporaceae bacterium]|nr:hypothetical protein [Micromonosporaceae bacterium]